MKVFEHTERVYFSDTDAQGIAYHGSYIDWAEHGRTEALREAFPDETFQDFMDNRHLLITVKHIKISYKKSAMLDQFVTVKTECIEMGGFSALFLQRIMHGDELLTELEVKLAFTDPRTNRLTRIPADIRRAFEPDGPEGKS